MRSALTVGALALTLLGCRKRPAAPMPSTHSGMSMPGTNMAMNGTNHSMGGIKMTTSGRAGESASRRTGEPRRTLPVSSSPRLPDSSQNTGTNQPMPGMRMSSTQGMNMSMPGMTMPAAGQGASSGVPNRVPVDLSQAQQQFIDIRTQPVKRADAVATIRAVGIVAYNQARLLNVNTRIMGWAERLYVDKPGQFVKKGEALMNLYSPDLYSAEDEYLLAWRQVQRFEHVRASDAAETNNVVWQESVGEARELLGSARKRLALWEIGDSEIAALQETNHASDTLAIRAPFTGYVIQKNIDPAQMVHPGMTLYTLADLSTVWINAQVYEYELPYVKVGQDVRVTAIAHPGRVFHAKVDFIYPYSENLTRTTIARLVMKNSDGLFKPNDYVNAEIRVDHGPGLLIPSSAVYNTGVSQYVFVEVTNGHFVPRPIVLGPHVANDQVVAKRGLSAGEKIVTDGNFLLDSESQLEAASAGGGQ
jgi:membrane fusion protein, copper/silver efflux system